VTPILAQSTGTVMTATAVGVAVLMIGTWLLSLVLHDVSIVDIVWGAGFVVVAWISFVVGEGVQERRLLLVALTTLWGLRLAAYLLWRNAGKGEDFRYQSMRRRQGPTFPIHSLLTVFGLQGLIMWVVSLPVQLGSSATSPDLGLLAVAGSLVWAVGFGFESIGDYQLARFKADPDNEGRVMDRGLWRYTRHPNYFGDCCVWWGLFVITLEADGGWRSIVGPLVMTLFLVRISGVAMLERSLIKRRPGYADYIARTSAFLPWPPKGG